MKYTKSLTEEVPKEIRLEVYKRAKELIENWKKETFGLLNPQLCLLLPSILYDCKNYIDDGNCEDIWYPNETILGFTEFTEQDIENIFNSSDKNIKRLELVNKWIEDLTK